MLAKNMEQKERSKCAACKECGTIGELIHDLENETKREGEDRIEEIDVRI